MIDAGFNGETRPPATGDYLRTQEIRAELERQVKAVGGVIEFCKIKGIDSHAPVSLALAGKRPVTEGIAIKMGFVPETMYRKL